MSVIEDPDEAAERERRRAAEMAIGHIPDCAYRKWARRSPSDTDIDIAEAWHQATPVHHPGAANGAVARYHRPSEMLLLARQGTLVSCYTVWDRSKDDRSYIRNQVDDL